MFKADELWVEGRKALEMRGLGREGVFKAPKILLCSPVPDTDPSALSGSLV